MSNYRRLISYIYAYEGGIKGKNTGFAKIEMRGSQCKITVNVKKVYVGGSDIGVYLLAGEKEILLGNIFIRGGSGEFRAIVPVNDVEHSGISMEECYGLTVHDVENTWRCYTTIWDDAVTHAAEVELTDVLPVQENAENEIQEERIKKAVREIEEEFPIEPSQTGGHSFSRGVIPAVEFSEELMPEIKRKEWQGKQNQDGQNQGSQNQGSQNQGSQNQGGQNQGNRNQGRWNQDSQNQGSRNQGSQNQKSQIRDSQIQEMVDSQDYRKEEVEPPVQNRPDDINGISYTDQILEDSRMADEFDIQNEKEKDEFGTSLDTEWRNTQEDYLNPEQLSDTTQEAGQKMILEYVSESGQGQSQMLETAPQRMQEQDQTPETSPHGMRDQSQIFETEPHGMRDQSQIFETEPQGMRDQSEIFETEPQGMRDQSQTFETSSQEMRDQNQTSETSSQGIRDQSQTFETSPQGMRDQSQIFEAVPQEMRDQSQTFEAVPQGIRDQSQTLETALQKIQEQNQTFEAVPQRMREQSGMLETAPQRMRDQSQMPETAPQKMPGRRRILEIVSQKRPEQRRMPETAFPNISASENISQLYSRNNMKIGKPEEIKEPARTDGPVRIEEPDSAGTQKEIREPSSMPSHAETLSNTVCYRTDTASESDHTQYNTQPPMPGNPEELEKLLEEEEEQESGGKVWEKLCREHAKILAFDYEKGCDILTIKPQDIGLLPRETWVYGNNSFLLHGYYNYRYLILARLNNPGGTPRYLLGVPGHYYSNERYMASMFGFPNFVLSKDQPVGDGRFGYWYTDVKLEQ